MNWMNDILGSKTIQRNSNRWIVLLKDFSLKTFHFKEGNRKVI